MKLPFGLEIVSRDDGRYLRKAPRRVVHGRGFAGADTGRLLAGWSATPRHPDEVIREDLATLRARSRDSFHNNDFVRRFVGMVRSNIVGPRGVLLQAQSMSSQQPGKPDRAANDAVEAAWARWGRAGNCDLMGRLTWPEMQRQAIVSAAIDGEILVRKIRGKEAGPFAFMIQHIDPHALDVGYNVPTKDGRRINMGIEYDAAGRRVAYHLLDFGKSPFGYTAANGRRYQSIPADDIIHAFIPDQVGQSRGYPWVSTALQRLKMLDGYFEAALVAARAGASKMGFITSADGAGYVGDGEAADGSLISDFEAGIIEQLSDGQSFQPFDPRYPHEQFDAFVKTCLQAVSGSLGVSYTGLSGNLEGVNYSSIRAGVLEEREAWKALQEWFIDSYCWPIFTEWLGQARLAKEITVFGVPLSGPDDKYMAASWQPRRWAWVDPQKDMQANILAIENNISTVSSVIRESGRDPDSVFMERAAEKARLEELGLNAADVIGQPVGTTEGITDGQQ